MELNFFEGTVWKRHEALLAAIGTRTDFAKVVIVVDTYTSRLVDQSRIADHAHESDDFVEIIGTSGVPVEDVFNAYSRKVHLIIPDNHTVVPWEAITDHKEGQGIYLQDYPESQSPLFALCGILPNTSRNGIDNE